jgi:SAM-dependent methyltransferase
MKSAIGLLLYQFQAYRRSLAKASDIGYHDAWSAWRQFPEWRKSMNAESYFDYGKPWIVYDAIQFLEEHLDPGMKVFEYGSGVSTLFLSERVERVYGVEHDKEWYQQVQDILSGKGLDKYELFLAEPEASGEGSPANPLAYVSSKPEYEGKSFAAYAQVIRRFPDQFFDLITIDGRSRPACFMEAVSKVKPGGFLLFDNFERPHYHPVVEQYLPAGTQVHTFKGPTPYSHPFSQTNIWQLAASSEASHN